MLVWLRLLLPEVHFAQKLPSEFYARALSNLALTPQPLYRQSMQDLLLQQALQHLDPDRQGLAITLAVCTLPRAGRKLPITQLGVLRPWRKRGIARHLMQQVFTAYYQRGIQHSLL